MDHNIKLLAVYEDLLKKIEEVMDVAQTVQKQEGPAGKDGRDGVDAKDHSASLFAAVATLHSDLLKELISMEREIKVNPQINVNSSAYTFDIERNNRGLIEKVHAKPINSNSLL